MKKQREQEPEQFEAYGEYSYAYQPAPEQSAPPAEKRRSRSRSTMGRLVFLLAVAAITIIVLQSVVFRLETVYVVGNKRKSPQQIAAASGLVKGLNIFAVSEEEVRRNLASDHTIIFQGMQKQYPGAIYLYVDERETVAVLQWLGIQYTLDETGLVMDESNALTLPDNIPIVTGMHGTSVRVGRQLEVRRERQRAAYCAIISELQLQIYSDQISELNLANTDNLYLVTVDGITVRLGDETNMRAKIGALRTDVAYLRLLGKNTGILDVTTPEDAKFTPDG